jgi:hypothetical protein
MKIKKNGVSINLTESDLKRIVKSQMINKSLITEEDSTSLEKKVAENTAAIYELKKWREENDRKLRKWMKQNPQN